MDDDQITKLYFMDDSEDEVFLTALMLEQERVDIEIVHAYSMSGLTEKLRQVEKQRRHNAVVLLDMNMPRMRGTEILRQLRNDEDYRDMIIGICTGSDDPADKRTACEAGADFYVSKPLNLRALNDMCRQVEHVAVQTDANGQVSLRAVQ